MTEKNSQSLQLPIHKRIAGFVFPVLLKYWHFFFILVWLAGVVIILIRQLVGRILVSRIAHRAEEITAHSWLNLFNQLKHRCQLLRPIQLFKSNKTNMVMTWGVVNPKILLPATADQWSDEHKRCVLMHELAHVKRRDTLTQLFVQLVCVLYWFNPVIWMAYRRFLAEREHACDDHVLMEGSKASEYADLILQVARSLNPIHFSSLATVSMARKTQLEGRLLSILNPKKKRRNVTSIGAVVVTIAILSIVLPLAGMRTQSQNKVQVQNETMILDEKSKDNSIPVQEGRKNIKSDTRSLQHTSKDTVLEETLNEAENVEKAREETIASLLEKRADPNVKNKDEEPALINAIDNNNTEIATLLLEKGADPNATDEDGKSALSNAIDNNNTEIAKLLLEKDADPNSTDEDGEPALINAIDNNNTEIARLLLEKGADPNATDEDGESALSNAIDNNNTEIAKLLLEKDADPNVKDKDGEPALIEEIDDDNMDTAKSLIENGTHVNEKNADRDRLEKSFQVGQGGTLTVDTDLGSIDVTAERSNRVEIKINRKKKTPTRKEVSEILDHLNIDFYQRGDDVFVEAKYKKEQRNFFKWERRRLNLEFLISVPEKYNVDLKTSGGGITVDDLEGRVRAKTSGGGLKFGSIRGPVWGHTSGGSITLSGCRGDAEVHTSGGSIKLGHVDGNVNAKTSGGSIKIGSVKGTVDAKTSGGGITVEEVMGFINAQTSGGSISATISEQPRTDCRLTTSGGGIYIHLADHVQVTIDAKASGGGVRTDFPVTVQGKLKKNVLQAKINGGGPELYLRTSGGGINIRKM